MCVSYARESYAIIGTGNVRRVRELRMDSVLHSISENVTD